MTNKGIDANPWMMLPFGVLLAMIALGPVLAPAWWGRNYSKAAYGLGAVTLLYYFVGLQASHRVWETTHEYASFICLIGSLYVVSGGIHINVKDGATPLTNVLFLLAGAVIANIVGTTGASMLLIRPWLRMNRQRIQAYHVIFFIFIVSNVGGCLTPIGDPPLFWGYLMGIPFWWVAEYCLPIWAVGVGMLLLIFFAWDWRNYSRTSRLARVSSSDPHEDRWRFDGISNVFFLAVILAAIFINRPLFLREGLMLLAALGSWYTTRKSVHESNRFDFHPIQEVAILFAGIFATMMPALDWLQGNAGGFEGMTASALYWGSGTLSSALDNAPTYVCFLKAILARFVDGDVVSQINHLIQTPGLDLAGITGPHAPQIQQTILALQKYHGANLAGANISLDEIKVACLLGDPRLNTSVLAVSIGAVFFGANTYIGNGPNFMVKSIADHERVAMPSFLGYVFKFTLPVMVPMLAVVWWLFFRR